MCVCVHLLNVASLRCQVDRENMIESIRSMQRRSPLCRMIVVKCASVFPTPRRRGGGRRRRRRVLIWLEENDSQEEGEEEKVRKTKKCLNKRMCPHSPPVQRASSGARARERERETELLFTMTINNDELLSSSTSTLYHRAEEKDQSAQGINTFSWRNEKARRKRRRRRRRRGDGRKFFGSFLLSFVCVR